MHICMYRGCGLATTTSPHLFLIDHPSVQLTSVPTLSSTPSINLAPSVLVEFESVSGGDMNAHPSGSASAHRGATFEKHPTVATCAVCLPDAVSVLVGDDVGGITLYSLQDRGRLIARGRHIDNDGAEAPGGRRVRAGSGDGLWGGKVLHMKVRYLSTARCLVDVTVYCRCCYCCFWLP